MNSHAWRWKILFAMTSFSVVAGWCCCAFAHKTDVHGSADPNLTGEAIKTSGISFYSTDVTRIKQGSIDEDVKGNFIADLGLPYRTMHHHYNPHTGVGKADYSGDPAVIAARERWNTMLTAFNYPARRWLGDESDGVQGSMHCLGRVLHLLEDMASPPHTHPLDGHGWPGKVRPGGNPVGFYSDFEETWSPSSSKYTGIRVYKSWPFPSVSGGSLNPTSAALPWSDRKLWNSRLDEYSWVLMRSELNGIPVAERDEIEGYMKAQAWISYFHTSFYGQINWDVSNPAPHTTSSGRTNILQRMFPGKISFTNGILDDYWTIDGVGYYDKQLQYFKEDWWPCPTKGTYPYGHKDEGSGSNRRILGRFYIYLHYYRVDDLIDGAPWPAATRPEKWPDNTSNSGTSLARYYGDILLPLSVRFCAGLLQEALLPSVDAFDVEPKGSVTSGSSFKISYTVSDDIGLQQTELWRATDHDSDGEPDWPDDPEGYIDILPLSGDKSYSGFFTDEPLSAGTYWYGLHAVNNRGFWSGEPDPPGPIKVTVSPPRPTVETRPATLIVQTAAMLNGRIVDDGGSSIIERRFDWGTTPSGDGWTDWTRDVSVSGDYFWYNLTSLNPGTTYYFQPWATNRDPADPSGWGQGSILSFTTTSPTVQYSITASAGANGSISPTGTIVKNAGESQQFTAMPNTDYMVDTWYLDGSADQTGGTTYTLNNIQSDLSVHVTFKSVPPQHTITVSAGANGSIGPSGTIVKNDGESQQFTAMPNTGYTVDTWYLDGSADQTGGTTYTLNNIQSDHAVYVTFKTIPPTTIYVPDDYATIQDAVDAANPGNTIIVRDGTYTENVDVNKSHLIIKSENGANAAIVKAANPDDHVFLVTVDYANISGFTIQGANGTEKAGISLLGSELDNVEHCHISNNVIAEYFIPQYGYLRNYHGIRLQYASNNTLAHNRISKTLIYGITIAYAGSNILTNNTLTECGTGIYLAGSSENTLTDNIAESNMGTGICLTMGSHNNTFVGNTMLSNRYNFDVEIGASGCLIQNIDTSNTVDGKPIYYLVNKNDLVIDSNWNVGYLGIVECNNVTMKDLLLSNNGQGVLLACSNNSRIENVNVSNNKQGFALNYSSNNTIVNNIADSTLVGFSLRFSSMNLITGNTVSNSNYEMNVLYSSNNNIVYLNNFINTPGGISFSEVLRPIDSLWSSAEEITYIYNAINTNTNYLGNYWGDYSGTDADGDGIGDTPYSIDGDSDNYPLMMPFENYEIGDIGDELSADFCGANFTDPDGYVDVWDLMQFADHWHIRTGEGNWDAKFDLAGPSFGDPDGYIDVWDLMNFADHWHEGEKP